MYTWSNNADYTIPAVGLEVLLYRSAKTGEPQIKKNTQN